MKYCEQIIRGQIKNAPKYYGTWREKDMSPLSTGEEKEMHKLYGMIVKDRSANKIYSSQIHTTKNDERYSELWQRYNAPDCDVTQNFKDHKQKESLLYNSYIKEIKALTQKLNKIIPYLYYHHNKKNELINKIPILGIPRTDKPPTLQEVELYRSKLKNRLGNYITYFKKNNLNIALQSMILTTVKT